MTRLFSGSLAINESKFVTAIVRVLPVTARAGLDENPARPYDKNKKHFEGRK
jgi:hypothetical protein